MRSHPVTAELVTEPSPLDDRAYKHREDLVDALICAWTGLLWIRHGFDRCQVLGLEGEPPPPAATIIAPCRPAQRAPVETRGRLSTGAVRPSIVGTGTPRPRVEEAP